MSGARVARGNAVPAGEQAREPRRHLRLVTEPRSGVRPRTVGMFAVGVFLVAVFVLASLHALLVQGQLELDQLDDELRAHTEYAEELDQRIAHLESPDRIVAEATALGLVVPGQVVYLEPVLPGEPAGAATTPEIASGDGSGPGEVEDAAGLRDSTAAADPDIAGTGAGASPEVAGE